MNVRLRILCLVSVVLAALGHGCCCCCLCPVPSLHSANKLIAALVTTSSGHGDGEIADSGHNNTFSNLHLDGISDVGSRMQITLG